MYPNGEDLLKKLDRLSVDDLLLRRALIRIVCAELTETYSTHYMPAKAKLALAKAIVKEFPQLKEKESEGHVSLYYYHPSLYYHSRSLI